MKPLVLAYAVICLAFQLRLSYDWLSHETFSKARVRRPFNIRNFDSTGQIDAFPPPVARYGIAKGDIIVSIDGKPYLGSGHYYRALDGHAPGEDLRLRLRRDGAAEFDVRIPLIGVPDSEAFTARDFVELGITQILTPLLSLALGLLVLVRRSTSPLSWLVFGFLVSFSILASGGLSYEPVRMISQWAPGLRHFGLAHLTLWIYLWSLLLFLFAVRFPYRAEWDARNPWIKWLLIVPIAVNAIARAFVFPLGVENLTAWHALVHFVDTTLLPARLVPWLSALAVAGAVAELARKLITAPDADMRRRLRVLAAGSAVAWIPFLLIVFSQDLFGVRIFGWQAIVAISLLLVFPVTLVYLILVDRALDIGVTIREGLQYTLARRSLFVIQAVVIAIVIFVLAVSLGEPGLNLPKRMNRVAIGIVVGVLSKRFVEKAGRWVDRRFFREQYRVDSLLTDLAREAGQTADRERLRTLVTTRIGEALHADPVHLITGDTSRFAGVLSRLSRERAPLALDRRRPPAWLTSLDHAEASHVLDLRGELILPVARQDRLMGFLSLGPRRSEQPYAPSDIAVLESVAAQTALSLDNAALAETVAHEAASREILDRELQIAKEVQGRLLPRTAPAIPGLDVAGVCVPAREVGGDSFDYLALPNGEWAIAIGDVAGKGVSAALLMASLQASLRGLAADGIPDLPQLMKRLNRLMYDSTPSNRFATFQLCVFDPATRRLRLSSAGHNPALLLPAAAGGCAPAQWIRPRGVALGLTREASYAQAELTLSGDDVLILYTDGVTEAMNPAAGQFGETRLAEWAASARGDAAAKVSSLVNAVAAFAAGAPQHDDITVVVGQSFSLSGGAVPGTSGVGR